MIRPTAAFCIAVFAAVGLALGTGYAFYPVQSDVAKLSVVKPPREASSTAEKTEKENALHVVREHPMREGQLVSPFLPEHPTREQARAAKTVLTQKPEPKETQQAAFPARETEIRLVGVVSSESGRRAILSVAKRHVLLAPGEEKDGVTLVSLTEKTATVLTPTGERELSLSAGNIK